MIPKNRSHLTQDERYQIFKEHYRSKNCAIWVVVGRLAVDNNSGSLTTLTPLVDISVPGAVFATPVGRP